MKIREKRTKEYEYGGFTFLATIQRVSPIGKSFRRNTDVIYICKIKDLGNDDFTAGHNEEIKGCNVRNTIENLVAEAEYYVDSINKETDEFVFMKEEGFVTETIESESEL